MDNKEVIIDDFKEKVDYIKFKNGILLNLFQDANIHCLKRNGKGEYILSISNKETNDVFDEVKFNESEIIEKNDYPKISVSISFFIPENIGYGYERTFYSSDKNSTFSVFIEREYNSFSGIMSFENATIKLDNTKIFKFNKEEGITYKNQKGKISKEDLLKLRQEAY